MCIWWKSKKVKKWKLKQDTTNIIIYISKHVGKYQIIVYQFDNTFFSNKAFQSLENFNQNIVSEDEGRSNPFAPSFALSASSTVEGLGFQETTATSTQVSSSTLGTKLKAQVLPGAK